MGTVNIAEPKLINLLHQMYLKYVVFSSIKNNSLHLTQIKIVQYFKRFIVVINARMEILKQCDEMEGTRLAYKPNYKILTTLYSLPSIGSVLG